MSKKMMYIVPVILIAGGLGVFIYAGSQSEEDNEGSPMTPNRVTDPEEIERLWTPPPKLKTEEEKVQEKVAELEAYIDNNMEAPDAPEKLMRLANLYYYDLKDYEQAAGFLNLIIRYHPNADAMVRAAYIKLDVCYRKTDNLEARIQLYQDMMEYFPPDSQEYLFAKQESEKF